MTFIVVFVALLVERFFDWSHLRQWQWFRTYQGLITEKIPGLASYLGLAVTLLPLLLAVLILQSIFQGLLYGFVSLLFEILILLFCFGPCNLWAEVTENNASLTSGESDTLDDLALEMDVSAKDEQGLQKQLLMQILAQANRRVFAVLFWFVILGPVGAVLYRLVAVSLRSNAIPGLAQSAAQTESALSWPSVRFFSLMFALGGNFTKTIDFWTKNIKMNPADNKRFLLGCSYAALGIQSKEKPVENADLINSCLGLVDRSLIITLIFIAFFTLMGL